MSTQEQAPSSGETNQSTGPQGQETFHSRLPADRPATLELLWSPGKSDGDTDIELRFRGYEEGDGRVASAPSLRSGVGAADSLVPVQITKTLQAVLSDENPVLPFSFGRIRVVGTNRYEAQAEGGVSLEVFPSKEGVAKGSGKLSYALFLHLRIGENRVIDRQVAQWSEVTDGGRRFFVDVGVDRFALEHEEPLDLDGRLEVAVGGASLRLAAGEQVGGCEAVAMGSTSDSSSLPAVCRLVELENEVWVETFVLAACVPLHCPAPRRPRARKPSGKKSRAKKSTTKRRRASTR